LGGETQVSWNHQVVVGLNPYFPSIPITSFFNATMTIFFCKDASDFLMTSLLPRPQKKKLKLKKSWNLIFDSIHSQHHRVTIRISMHMFLIFHGYL
jgi:hypothetical protein